MLGPGVDLVSRHVRAVSSTRMQTADPRGSRPAPERAVNVRNRSSHRVTRQTKMRRLGGVSSGSPDASGIAIILRDGGSAAALMPGGGSKSIRRHRTDVRPGGTNPSPWEPSSKRHRLEHLPARHDPWRTGRAPAAARQRRARRNKFPGGQASKGIRWMPWHQEAMKDVAKLR